MFCIKIADIVVGIENKYSYIEHHCRKYIVRDQQPAFIVSATEEEILDEWNEKHKHTICYLEGLCLHKKIGCKLAQFGAFYFHAAVIAVDGVAYAFAAPSGTGKTTHIRLWMKEFGDKVEIVNGDKPILKYKGDILYVCGTPWRGKEGLGKNIERPLQAVCFLEQSSENHIQQLGIPDVNKRIFQQILLPREKDNFNCFWPLLEKMVTTTDFYLLQCNQEPEAAELAYRTLRRR